MKARVQRNVSALIGAIGLVLVVMMITTEGEPGALPLGLILIGAVGYVTGRMREKSATRQ
jgi:preprotein translocase subunit Sss1